VKVGVEDGTPVLSYRTKQVWAATTRVLVSVDPKAKLTSDERDLAETRLPGLATLYASFVTGDDVQSILAQGGPLRGVISATTIPGGPGNSQVLPIIAITAEAHRLRDALRLADRSASALSTWVDRQQRASDPDAHVQLSVLNRAGSTPDLLGLVRPRSKTLPIVVFLVVMFATIGLAFVLENLRPRPQPQTAVEPLRRAVS
jgi:hypothetical protein